MKIFTIGAFGKSADQFFEALIKNKIDLLVDVRRKRAIRGSDYVWANAKRLESKLEELGIDYLHLVDLSPSMDMIQDQMLFDKKEGKTPRTRERLSPGFKNSYKKNVLTSLQPQKIKHEFLGHQRIALFCIEEKHEACHRSLLAKNLASEATIKHL